MKKNDLFLLSFILFIFTCLTVKDYWDFPLWSSIVSAITIASGFFAIADLFRSSHKYIQSIVEAFDTYPDDSLHSLKQIQRTINIRLEQLDKAEEIDSPYTKDEEIEYYSSIKDGIKDLEKTYDGVIKGIKIQKVLLSINKIAYCVFTVIGFLSLFCIIVFEQVSNFFISSQDIWTVLAFGIILLTQFLESITENTLSEVKSTIEKCFDGIEALRGSFEREVRYNRPQ